MAGVFVFGPLAGRLGRKPALTLTTIFFGLPTQLIAIFFVSLLVFYLLSSWLALLITTAGFSMEKASLMGATLAAGGTEGAILIGRLMDRFEPHRVLAAAALPALLAALAMFAKSRLSRPAAPVVKSAPAHV